MKRLQANTVIKLLAGVLLVASLVGLVGGCAGIALLSTTRGNQGDGSSMKQSMLESVGYSLLDDAEICYRYLDDSHMEMLFDPANTNAVVEFHDADGKLLSASGSTKAATELLERTFYDFTGVEMECKTLYFDTSSELWEEFERLCEEFPELPEYGYSDYYDVDRQQYVLEYQELTTPPKEITCTLYLKPVLSVHDGFYYVALLADLLVSLRNALPWLCIGFAMLALALLAFICCGVGHRRDSDEIALRWMDRLPLEVYWALLAVVAAGMGVGIALLNDMVIDWWSMAFAAIVVLCVGIGVLVLLALLSFCVRVKAGQWWRNTLCFRVLRQIGRCIRYLLVHLPLYWKAGLIWGGLSLVEFCTLAGGFTPYIWVWLLEKLILTPILVIYIVNLNRLQQMAHGLAEGCTKPVPTGFLLPGLRRFATDLGSTGVGMQRAVQQQTRAERMKTELITNVSHDIKTPLTSIINYVDLLQKEALPEGAVQEYVQILDRQSRRLKKLTDDLVEASKAATGNINAQLEPTDVNVLLSQVAGEYEERLRQCHLEPVLQLLPQPAMILADGRLMWRVMENLLGNVCKYAAPNTRVYFGASQQGSKLTIWVKNISHAPLNISGDELQERFVRGDSARSTEGSGLGLSIARSLTQLQKGYFNILIDADLFKAILVFDVLPQTAGAEADEAFEAPEATEATE